MSAPNSHRRRSGAPPVAGELTEADTLRALVRQAHEAIRDLTRLIATEQRIRAGFPGAVRAVVREAGGEEITAYGAHLQAELNRAAADLNASIVEAREHIIAAISPTELVVHPDAGTVTVHWSGGLFDTDPTGTGR